jgi:hypothetical protein
MAFKYVQCHIVQFETLSQELEHVVSLYKKSVALAEKYYLFDAYKHPNSLIINCLQSISGAYGGLLTHHVQKLHESLLKASQKSLDIVNIAKTLLCETAFVNGMEAFLSDILDSEVKKEMSLKYTTVVKDLQQHLCNFDDSYEDPVNLKNLLSKGPVPVNMFLQSRLANVNNCVHLLKDLFLLFIKCIDLDVCSEEKNFARLKNQLQSLL